MPSYKLHYFDERGRAENVRLCFAFAGVKYKDFRYTNEDWQKKKERLSPMGYLPVLEVDGKKLCEGLAILRYVAKEHGLCPSDNFEVALCDQIIGAIEDVMVKIVNFLYYEKDEEKKKTLRKKFDSIHLPECLTNVTALLKSNKDGKGFLVGDKLSYADIASFNFCGIPIVQSAVEKYPELKAHQDRIGEIAGIKEWVKNRPKTYM